MRLTGSVATHVGNVRETNQDRAHFGGYVAVVADGMGGHQGGEMAATIAVNEFLDVIDPIAPGGLVELVEDANRAIFERAADPDLRGMGTTLVALTLRPTEEKVSIVNVGDSRAYFVRGDSLGQLTLDHSLVEDLVRQNRLTPDEALTHPQRNILTRALGIASEVEVDRFLIPTKVGDRFLLCSDGLFNEVSEDEILRILSDCPDVDLAADMLVSAALAGAGRDNITVAVVDVVGDDHPAGAMTAPQTLQMPVVETGESDLSAVSSVAPTIGQGPSSGGSASARATAASRGAVGLAEPEMRSFVDEFEPALPEAVDTLDVPATPKTARRFAPVLLVIGITALFIAAGYYLAGMWSDRTWYVAPATDGTGALTAFNGQPDGFLWVDAEPWEEIGVDLDELTPEGRLAVGSGETFGSLDEALEFVRANMAQSQIVEDGGLGQNATESGAAPGNDGADDGQAESGSDGQTTARESNASSKTAPADEIDAGS